MISQTMFFPFPCVFVRLSFDLLILTLFLMGMTNEENLDVSSSKPVCSTGGADHGYRNKNFWQNKCPNSMHGDR